MAEQQGFLPYSGKLGNTVGYRRGKKHFERAKPGSYQPGEESLKSGSEFGKGSTACALLKTAFKPLLLRSFSVDLHNRLSGKLREIIRTGLIAKKGEREVFDGNLKLLKGFEFNSKVNFSRLNTMLVDTQITTGEIKVRIKPFDWKNKISAPGNALRIKIGFCCVFADFRKGNFNAINANVLIIEKGESFPGGKFSMELPSKGEFAVILMMNSYFENDIGGKAYMIENKNFQAGVILDVAHVKDGKLVEFIAEELPEKQENPTVAVDAFWELGWDDEES